MAFVTGPISWLTAGSEATAPEPPVSLPEVGLDPMWGVFAPEDADTVLDDFGRDVTIEGLGDVKIMLDHLMFVDEHGSVVQTARNYMQAKIKRGALDGARLSNTTLIVSNGVTQSTFRVIGPVARDTSLFDVYVLEPKRRES